jgi:hypothetical protein
VLPEQSATEKVVGDMRDGLIIIQHCAAVVPRSLDSTSVALHQPVEKEEKNEIRKE